MDFEPYFKVHNLVSIYPKSIIFGQLANLNMIIHVMVSVYRLVKIWNSPQFPVLLNVFDEKSPPFRRPHDQKNGGSGDENECETARRLQSQQVVYNFARLQAVSLFLENCGEKRKTSRERETARSLSFCEFFM